MGRNCELRKFSRVSKVMGGMANRDHCIATDFLISLTKLDHGREGSLHVVGTMHSDSISAFVRASHAVDAFHGGVMPELGLQCVMLLKR